MTASKSTESAALDASTLLDRQRAERKAFEYEDGRKITKRERTKTLSLKVRAETVHTLHRIKGVEDISMTEIVERAIALYDAQLRGSK